MDDLLREFLTETSESIAQMDVELVRLEQTPNDPELLGSIFRLVHTIKGTCGFLGLPRLEQVAHAGENVLGKFRDGELKVTPAAVTLILKSIDTIKNLMTLLEQTEAEPPGNDEELIAELNAMANGGEVSSSPAVATSQPASEFELVLEPVPDIHGFVPVPAFAPSSPSPPPSMQKQSAPVAAESPPAKTVASDAASKESVIATQSIRVDVGLLENLMTIVSELVLTRNQLLQILRNQKETTFAVPLQRLNQVTSELQEGVMKTRMQPIGNAWSKLPRIIRDLSVELGKKIDLQMIGEETELDRQVLELIKDPLTHMVRNSADHGIEGPAERLKAGKKETGTVTLNAYHQGGHIIIEIKDDGKGLALDKIKAKAIQNGIATESELAAMPDQQIMQYIFKAGFSTAAKVTSVSGRGVGMDVVRTNIEKIGGTVDLKSVEGKGSNFLIKIPLTLAIVSALIIECGGERFAIPQLSVVELVHASAHSEHRIEEINKTPVLRLRDRLLPLISMRDTLRLDTSKPASAGLASIIVVQVGGSTFGIIVDHIFDTEEIVVKPVSPILRNIPVFSGNTILGDGSVVMILDPNGIAAQAGDIQAPADSVSAATAMQVHKSQSKDRQALLLFKADDDAPKAVPLALVARLENIDRKTIEYTNGVPIVQYRDQLMPLLSLSGRYAGGDQGSQPIIVFGDDHKNVGIIVDEILDIVEEHVAINSVGQRPGCFGSAVICGKATDMIDIASYLEQALQNWFSKEEAGVFEMPKEQKILLVDDSAFFRNLLTPALNVAGYNVTCVENPSQALELHESGANFDAIVSDIEMPKMNGFDFVSAIRRESRWSDLPVFALSSHATESDFERGRQAGFTDYVGKFNRDGLLAALHTALDKRMEAHI